MKDTDNTFKWTPEFENEFVKWCKKNKYNNLLDAFIKSKQPPLYKEQERITVEVVSGNNGKPSTVNTILSKVRIKNLPAIKQAIEAALNEDTVVRLSDEEIKELARRYYGNLKIGALFGENATEINEDIERRVFDFYVGYKTANGEKIPNKVFQPLNYLKPTPEKTDTVVEDMKDVELFTLLKKNEELEQRIEFWKESNNSNYESFKRVAYELRALKKQYRQISLNPDNKAYTGKVGVAFYNQEGKMVDAVFANNKNTDMGKDKEMPETKYMNTVEAYNEGYIQGVKFCEKYGIPKHQIGAGKSTKPPLGLLPKHIWEEQRIWDIAAAIERYKEAGKEIPQEWINENYDLRKLPKPKSDTGKDSNVVTDNSDVPILSLNDLLEVWDERGIDSKSHNGKLSPMYKRFEQKANQKLKTHTP